MKSAAFLAEGPHSAAEALRSPRHEVRELYVTAAAAAREPQLLAAAHEQGVIVRVVDERALASIGDTVTPQGVVAVVAAPEDQLTDLAAGRPCLVAVLDGVADPGNAGTVIRTAAAAGADAAVVTRGSVDVWSPKCVRAGAGAHFHLPVVTDASPGEVADVLAAAGCQVLATAADGPADLDQLDRAGRLAAATAWVFGGEAHGVPPAMRARADAVVRLPMYGGADSLNLAAAAAVFLYASARAQRRSTAPR